MLLRHTIVSGPDGGSWAAGCWGVSDAPGSSMCLCNQTKGTYCTLFIAPAANWEQSHCHERDRNSTAAQISPWAAARESLLP